MIMDRSRLSKRLKRKTKKTLLLSILGIVLIIFLLIKFGIPLIVNFTLLISGSKNDPSTINSRNDSSFIMPPLLNPLSSATNSAKISISGIASQKQIISLYLNDQMQDKTKVKNDNTFSFEDLILSEGENVIKAKATDNDKESSFSEPMTIIYKNSPPHLSIDSPSDGQSFSKEENSIIVSGSTDPGAKITINDLWAIVDANGNYAKNLLLKEGENNIVVIAIDEAGNKTELKIKVNYSP